jgi:hypothetical protein
VQRSYDLGASSFMTRPISFDDLVKAMGTFTEYWFETAELNQGRCCAPMISAPRRSLHACG